MNRIFALDGQIMKRSFQLIVLLTAFACSAFGSTITFTDITTASGTIGSTSFTNDPITISAVGDTSKTIECMNLFSLNNSSASITIDGLGTFLFTTGTRFFASNGTESVGFSRAGLSGLDLIDGPLGNSAFSSWSMLTSIGPITGSGEVTQWGAGWPPVVTTGGTLVLDDATPVITFSAKVDPADPAVPEPGTFLLLATGLLGIGRFVKQRIAS
jgi:hypothetical protein